MKKSQKKKQQHLKKNQKYKIEEEITKEKTDDKLIKGKEE